MKRYSLVTAERSKEIMIRSIRMRQLVRNAAIALAIIFGSLVLYFSLVPALAENGETSKYIYFDNGISMYDKVEYSLDGGNSYTEMIKLSQADSSHQPVSDKNVNKDFVYVTMDKIPLNSTIKFMGTASGTVYDSMSNYQVSSASREWGYNYEKFKWISAPVTTNESWNCYFAPAKAMQYKYNGRKDDGTVEYFIKPEPWAHENVTQAYSLSFDEAPMIMEAPAMETPEIEAPVMEASETEEPETEEYEDAELFFESENPMEGSIGSVEEEIILDEELLSEFDTLPYEDDDGIQVLANGTPDAKLYASGLSEIDSLTYDLRIDDTFTIKATSDKSCKIDGDSARRINLGGAGDDTGRSIQFNAKQGGRIVIVAQSSNESNRTLKFWKSGNNAAEATVTNQETTCEFTFSEGGTYYIASKSSALWVYSVEVYYSEDSGSSENADPFWNANENLYMDEFNPSNDNNYGIFTVSGEIWRNNPIQNDTNKYNEGKSVGDGRNYEFIRNFVLAKADSKIQFNAKQAGVVKIYASSNSSSSAELQLIDSGNTQIAKKGVGNYHAPVLLEFEFSTAGIYTISACDGKEVSIYAIGVYYTTGGGTSNQGGNIDPADRSNRTFYGYTYDMNGKLGLVNDVNDIGNNSQGANLEGSYATGSNSKHGLNDDEYNKAFNAKATFYDYYSDWELAGIPLNIDRYFYESTASSDIDLYNKINYKAAANNSSTSHGDKIADKGKTRPDLSAYSGFVPITFSDGTNTVAYTYQGDLWNQAIRDHYVPLDISALYFGSNSWFTGNGRYDNEAGHEPYDSWSFTGNEAMVKTSPASNNNYAYRIPDQLEYVDILFDPWNIKGDAIKNVFSDELHGFSYSRAFEGWVNPTLTADSKGSYALKTESNASVVYFDEEFLLGENDKNTVYGKVYKDVDFDFKYDEETGYFYYDSTKEEYATRLTLMKGTNNKYYMDYTGEGVTKADKTSEHTYQFYPFNSPAANADFYRENLMFGMKLEIPFVTYEDSDRRTGIFKFSGDDDVWVYIDGQLALDIGGTHTAVGGVIDMQTGYAVVQSTYDSATGGKAGKITDAQEAAFAIGTLTRINTSSSSAAITAKLFDDTYSASGGCSTVVDETNGLFKVTLKGTVQKNGEDVSDGNLTYSFKLTDLKETLGIGKTPDSQKAGILDKLEDHVLTIYYMERGLNSSNLKLSFKLPDTGKREVRKVWADDEFGTDHSQDSVTVELYRTKGDSQTDNLSESYDFESNFGNWYFNDKQWNEDGQIAISSDTAHSGNNSLHVTGRKESFHGPQLDLVKGADNKYYPGETYHFSAWAMYRSSGSSSAEEHRALYTAIFDDEQEKGWKVRGSGRIWFSGWNGRHGSAADYKALGVGDTRTASWNGAALDLKTLKLDDGSSIIPGQSYSFSVYVKHTDTDDRVTYKLSLDCGNNSYPEIARTTVSRNEWGKLENISFTIPENTPDLLLYVETVADTDSSGNVTKEYLNNFYIDDVVIATAGSTIVDTTVTNESTGNSDGSSDTDSENAPENFRLTLKYTEGSDTKFLNIDEKPLKPGEWIHLEGTKVLPATSATEYRLYVETVPDHNTSEFYIDDVEIKRDVVEEDVLRVGEPITLTQDMDWHYVWDRIINSERLLKANGEEEYVQYDYYIREVSVNIGGEEKLDSHYLATYYTTETGKQLTPVTLRTNVDGKEELITAYLIDSEMFVTEVVNTPITDLSVYKIWDGVADTLRKDITIDIYDDLGTLVSSVTLNNGNDWKADLAGLPKYRREPKERTDPETGETEFVSKFIPITYYGLERNPGEFVDSYSSAGKSVNGRTMYPFVEVDYEDTERCLALTVTNAPKSAEKYTFRIIKRSAEDHTTLLAGVKFELYSSTDDGTNFNSAPTAVSITGQDGVINFGEKKLTVGGIYKLVETRAAAGYVLEKTELIFTVESNNGNLSYRIIKPVSPDDHSKYLVDKELDTATNTLTFTLENQLYKINMPATGGGGIVYLFAGAFGMMIMSLILLTFADRRRDQ